MPAASCWCCRTATSGPSRRWTTRSISRTACSWPAMTALGARRRSSSIRTPGSPPASAGPLPARTPHLRKPPPAATQGASRNCRSDHAADDRCKLCAYISSVIENLQEQGPVRTLEQGRERQDRRKMHKRIVMRLDRLDAAIKPDEMNVPGLDFHALHGLDPKRYSVHVNGPWCITFEFEDGEACRVDFEQYH